MSELRRIGTFAELARADREKRAREAAVPAAEAPPVVSLKDTLPVSDTATLSPKSTLPSQKSTVPVSSTLLLSDTVEVTSNYTKIPNSVLDDALSTLSPAEQVVYLRLIRLSYGYRRRVCTVGYDALASRCNLSRSGVRLALKTLEGRGLVARVGVDNAAAALKNRGTIYHVVLPEGTVLQSDRVPVSSRVSGSDRVSARDTRKDMGSKDKGKAPAAPLAIASAEEQEPKWLARTIATRFYEHHRNDGLYSRARLRSDVVVALEGQGLLVSEVDLEWALSAFPLPE